MVRKDISRSDNVKFLGVLLDETLSWRSDLVALSRKLARSVGIFYKLRHFVPLETLKSVCHALFYPFLSYDITVWGATHGQCLKPVLVSQEKVVRAMTFSDPFAHSLPLFSDLQILKLDDIYHLYVFSFVYECHNNLAPNHLVIILPRCLILIITILEVPPMVTFFLRERTLYGKVYALFVLMDQKFGITSLLISETLHQLETSRKRSNNCFLSLITQTFDYACSVWYSLS